MKKNAQYEISYDNSTIIVTKKFQREASVMDTPEFEDYMKLREKFPDFKFVVREIKKNAEKETYRNLTYTNMETFIMETYKSNEKEQKDRIGEYQSARVIAQIQPSPYAYVKAWFLEEYGDEYHKYRKSEDKDDKVANNNSAEK